MTSKQSECNYWYIVAKKSSSCCFSYSSSPAASRRSYRVSRISPEENTLHYSRFTIHKPGGSSPVGNILSLTSSSPSNYTETTLFFPSSNFAASPLGKGVCPLLLKAGMKTNIQVEFYRITLCYLLEWVKMTIRPLSPQLLSEILIAQAQATLRSNRLDEEKAKIIKDIIAAAEEKITDKYWLSETLSGILNAVTKEIAYAKLSLEEQGWVFFKDEYKRLTDTEQIYLGIQLSEQQIEELDISEPKKDLLKQLKQDLRLQVWAYLITGIECLEDIEGYYTSLLNAKEVFNEINQALPTGTDSPELSKVRVLAPEEKIDQKGFFNDHNLTFGLIQTIEKNLVYEIFEYFNREKDKKKAMDHLRWFFSSLSRIGPNMVEQIKEKLKGDEQLSIEHKIGLLLQAKIKRYTKIPFYREEGVELPIEIALQLYECPYNPEALEEEIDEGRGQKTDKKFDEMMNRQKFKEGLISAVFAQLQDERLGFKFSDREAIRNKASELVSQLNESGAIIKIPGITWQDATALAGALLLGPIMKEEKSIMAICDANLFAAASRKEEIRLYHLGVEAKYKQSVREIEEDIKKNDHITLNLANIWERFEYDGGVWTLRVRDKENNPRAYMFVGREQSAKRLIERFAYRQSEAFLMQRFDLYRDNNDLYYYDKNGNKNGMPKEGVERSESYLISRGLMRYNQARVLKEIGLGKTNQERFKEEFGGKRVSYEESDSRLFVSRIMGYCLIGYLKDKGKLEKEETIVLLGAIIRGEKSIKDLVGNESGSSPAAKSRLLADSPVGKKRDEANLIKERWGQTSKCEIEMSGEGLGLEIGNGSSPVGEKRSLSPLFDTKSIDGDMAMLADKKTLEEYTGNVDINNKREFKERAKLTELEVAGARKKFDHQKRGGEEDFQPRPFPGNTIVAWFDKDTQRKLKKIKDQLKSELEEKGLGDKIAFVEDNSLHLTFLDMVNPDDLKNFFPEGMISEQDIKNLLREDEVDDKDMKKGDRHLLDKEKSSSPAAETAIPARIQTLEITTFDDVRFQVAYALCK
ncbi:MAG: DUF1868 domain-containing protein, partial [Candidatus Omnitrophota bacterium]